MPLELSTIFSLIGFTAVIAQIVLMRELIVVFNGNEISLGIMLANWLLWTAVGSSLLGRLSRRVRNKRRLVAGLQMLVAVALPATILAARASKLIFQAVPGEILGPGPMLLTSLAALSLLCVVSGWLFAAGSQLCVEASSVASPAAATSSVYLWEAVGSGLGGILASLVLIRYLGSFEIASILALLNLLAATRLMLQPTSRQLAAAVALFAAFAMFIFPVGSPRLEALSLSLLWRGFRVVAVRNSLYGNLAVIETEGTRSLYENGVVVFTVPDPAAAEEAVHYALLQHPAPQSLLLIGGGINGSVAQALQHPSLERVDYVELDPAILDLARERFPQEWTRLRDDSRVAVHNADGRFFVKQTSSTFDVVIANLPDPQTAQLNRFYTREFFTEVAEKLNPGGILSFQVTGAENYISPELGEFLRCLNKTLRDVFPEVTAIPGAAVHFFASQRAGTLTTDPAVLVERLRARALQTSYVREYYLPFRMMPDRTRDLDSQIQPRPATPTNQDFAPIAYYFNVALWSSRFHQGYRRFFETIARVEFAELLGGVVLALMLLAGSMHASTLFRRPHQATAVRDRRYRVVSGFCVAVMGFTVLALEILLLLGFQAIYGYVYHQLAILIAAFMVGMAWGSRQALRRSSPGSSDPDSALTARAGMRTLAHLQILAAISPLILYGLFELLSRLRSPWGFAVGSHAVFPALALLAGMLGGYQFPVASRVYFARRRDVSPNLGGLYGLDLLGACLGALALSAYLLPVFGVLKTAMVIAVANLAPAVLAALAAREKPALPS